VSQRESTEQLADEFGVDLRRAWREAQLDEIMEFHPNCTKEPPRRYNRMKRMINKP
jgi:hypothetical protein